ncbi:hypothetical protein M9458_008254, partial [Cirrhinus mrigala]
PILMQPIFKATAFYRPNSSAPRAFSYKFTIRDFPNLISITRSFSAAYKNFGPHKSRRDRSPRKQSQHPSTASPRQRTHGKSPRPESNIKQWTVARLQRTLKDKGINFSRYDNKSRLFQLYTASINTPLNVNTEPSTLPAFARNPPIVTRDVTTQPSHRPRQAAPTPPSGDLTQKPSTPAPSTSEPSTFPAPPRYPPIVSRDVNSQPRHRPQQAASAPPSGGQMQMPPTLAPSTPELSQIITSFLSSLCAQSAPNPNTHSSFHPTILSSTLLSAVTSNTASVTTCSSQPNPNQVLLAANPGTIPASGSYAANPGNIPALPSALPNNLSFFPSLTHPNPSSSQYPHFTPINSSPYTLATAIPPSRPASAVLRPSPVSPALRHQILTGNYIDLAHLLQPSLINVSQPRELQTSQGIMQLSHTINSRSKDLTPTEFALAFSIYREIICSVYPDRRTELDDYLYIILDMAVRFGGNGFYNYHVFFATQAAGRLQQFNQGTYWGTLDTELYCRIFAARTSLSCELCGAPSHPASMCTVVKPQSSSSRQTSVFNRLSSAAPPPSIIPKPLDIRPTVNVPIPKSIDKRGRPILYQGGRMVCNNFNHLGCSLSNCRLLHVCSFCGDFIINGLQNGFHPGIEIKPDTSHISPNLQSALSEPNTVDTLIAKEVQEGFMIGPFKEPPFSPFRISPVGIATRKFSGKKRLIIDLSSPHGSHIPSINSIIPAPDFSMKYASIDQAISLIRKAGLGAWLSKADITSAFKVMPIHPEFWRFFRIFWKGAYYFAVRLTFGCKSSPKIFDSLSEALCWILINNHKLPYVLHLLDDFLIITPPSTPPSLGLSTLVQVFNELGVPLSKEKTLGPCTSIEFLGITLDSISFQASLPSEKVQRISLLLSNYLLADRCTKQQLLALLGHLNYAIRIIPQGKSFLSHLLSKVTSIPSLHDKVTLDEGCKMEMHLWQQFLSSWNGISFFYNDYVSQPEDIQLYTDAAPSTGFGGYYSGRWFASEWPPEFSHLAQQSDSPSSTLFEIYPVIIAAILWGHEWSKHIILIHSDNSAVVDIINKGRSRSPTIMQFIRRLTLISAQNQFLIRAAHIPGYHNSIADSLSGPWLQTQTYIPRQFHRFLLPSSTKSSSGRPLTRFTTLSAYLTGWNCFKAYHSYYQIPFPLLDVWSICNFVTHAHSNLNIRASTIQTYLSGINFILKLATGEQCHSISHSHVTMLIKGLRKQEPASSARRLPLTSDLLSQCICTLRSGYMSPPIDRTLECMFLLAFFGFLRCSELAPSTSAFNPVIHPSLSDISVHIPDSLIYTLKKSKTDQFGKSCPIYVFRLNSFISPFEPISEYVLSRYANNSSPQEPLFLTENGKMATRFWFNKHFLKVLSASGISPEHYSLHSFRIGVATTAASAGISDETIRVMGR